MFGPTASGCGAAAALNSSEDSSFESVMIPRFPIFVNANCSCFNTQNSLAHSWTVFEIWVSHLSYP